MKELKSFWNFKIQNLSQKRKYDSESNIKESNSSKLTTKKEKVLNLLEDKYFAVFICGAAKLECTFDYEVITSNYVPIIV
jgi:hypothetical protein